MNIISKALEDLKRRIPPQVLNYAFKASPDEGWRARPISLDERIMRDVIRPRVLVDCNLVGGSEITVSLIGLLADRGPDFTTVYRIPKERTQGRTITSALNITFTSPDSLNYGAGTSQQGGSMLMRLGQAMMDAHGAIPNISSADIDIIGENVIMVRSPMLMPGYAYLRCVVGNDEHLSHIKLSSYHHFCKLVEYAVKSHIYNSTVVDLDMGALSGGQALGAIKNEIEKYSDHEQMYEDYLAKTWMKVARMNDAEGHARDIRRMVGGNR